MKSILLCVFLPALLLASDILSINIPEFTNLVVKGPFVIKIYPSQSKSFQITLNQEDDLDKMQIFVKGQTLEISLKSTNLNLTGVQIRIRGKSFRSIKCSNGGKIIAGQINFLPNANVQLTKNSTIAFYNVTATSLRINLSSSSEVLFNKIQISLMDLNLMQRSFFEAKAGDLDGLTAMASANSNITLNNVKVKTAILTTNEGSIIEIFVTAKAMINRLSKDSEIRVFGTAKLYYDITDRLFNIDD